MAVERDVPDDRIKRAISALPDVQACNVEFDSSGSITAVHIVSSTKRPPKQIVRDVESVLIADFGIRIDHRKISVARVEDKSEAKPGKPRRPKIISIKLAMAGGSGSAEVAVERGDVSASGEASGVVAGGGMLRLVAAATLRALENLVDHSLAFELLDVLRVRTGERSAIVVFIQSAAAEDVRSLAGCVLFTDDDEHATARAVLDACNRAVEIIEPPERTEYEITPFPED